jgi:hypothetical protein
MTVRGKASQALAARSPAPQWSHVGLDPCFASRPFGSSMNTSLFGSRPA